MISFLNNFSLKYYKKPPNFMIIKDEKIWCFIEVGTFSTFSTGPSKKLAKENASKKLLQKLSNIEEFSNFKIQDFLKSFEEPFFIEPLIIDQRTDRELFLGP